MSRTWTPAQQAAIDDRGGTLLISAAAGSGKTAVLVQRVIDIICDLENPVDITSLLIVTFSNAAAAEMRQRIGQRLAEMLLEDPHNYHLQRQQSLLSSAHIRTVHAFCMELIKENFQNLPITPDFAIIDEKELGIMKADAAMEAIEEFHENDESGIFAELVDLLSTRRDDGRMIETIYKIYGFARSHPFYKGWLDRKLEMYNPEIPVSETPWGKTLVGHTRESLEYCLETMSQSLDEYIMGDEVLENAYMPAWESDIAQISNALDYLDAKDWDGVVGVLRTFDFVRLKAVRGEDTYKEKCQKARNSVKKIITGLGKKYMNATEAEFAGDIADLRPKIELLFELVKSFGDKLDEKKLAGRKMDFSDLEHYALQLLITQTETGYEKTNEARVLANRYSHILVDEYQDTNEVQDLIFNSLSPGDNLFMVGDVKQSIYSFRLAMPEIFIKKKNTFYKHDTVNYPAVISLDKNFRSRSQVTEGVNFIFSLLMTDDMGGVNYNGDESLKCGAVYPEQPLATPELMIIDGEGYEGEEDATYIEAKAVARRIAKMLREGYKVRGEGGLRPCKPGDFCILMRSPRSRSEYYIKALTEEGLTGTADNSGGFFQTREISAVVNLLLALDNPLLDVELTGAMLSPMFSFTDDELAEIRLCKKRVPFYLAVAESAKEGNEKCTKLIDIFDKLRYYAATHPADELIMEIYRLTNWLELARAMPFGDGRRSNLLLLAEYAKYYDTMGYKGLGGFASLLHRIIDQGGELDSSVSSGESDSVIRIMSVHKSKGLEFPVVILADTARRFNKRDLYESTLLHSTHGFACMRRNSETLSQYPTIPMGAIRLEMQKTLLSEEMRILYVALTRAEEKLIITASSKNSLAKMIETCALSLPKGKLPTFMVGESNCYADWIIMALLHHPDGEPLRELAGIDDLEIVPDDNRWQVEIITPEETERVTLAEEKGEFTAQPDKEIESILKERMSFKYPFENQTKITNKLSVSELTGREQSVKYRFNRRPKFLAAQKLTPTEKGNAMHKFMQFSDYARAKTNLEGEINRMIAEEFLSEKEGQSLSKEGLQAFFDSQLAERVFASPAVHRELRFISEFGQAELKGIIPEIDDQSKIVVQGIADCVFEENGKAYILDYKTDRILSTEELLERYEGQLTVYKMILEKTLDMPIGGCILYSFHLSSWIEA